MRFRMTAFLLAVVLLGGACTQSTTEGGQPAATSASNQSKPNDTKKTNDTKPPDAEGKPTETKRNKNAKTYKEALKLALDDIQQYWTLTMPDVYGQDYVPIPQNKLFGATSKKPGPACTPEGGQATYKDVEGNAFYCSLGKFVEWDDQTLLPDLYSRYGEYAVALVFAHEWGHAIQDQLGNLGGKYKTIITENQADCFAGAWTKHSLENKSNKSFRSNTSDLTSALAGLLEFADSPGGDPSKKGAHGTGFDRVNGFQTGFANGPKKCAEFTDTGGAPAFVDLQFATAAEAKQGGNLPYDDAVKLATADLNAYWDKLGKDSGFNFKKVDAIQVFSKDTSMPKCGKKQYSESEALRTIFFCVEDNYVAWDDAMLREVSDGIGDMGVAVLLAKQWAVSAQVQDNQTKANIESKTGHLQQSCFTGAWVRAVKEGDAHDVDAKGRSALSLSPGDLDKAIKAFLAFSDTPDTKNENATATAFEQVQAFRDGYLADNGSVKCASMTAPTK